MCDGIVRRSVGSVRKFERAQSVRKNGADVGSDQPLKTLHDGGQCYWVVVIQAGDGGLGQW